MQKTVKMVKNVIFVFFGFYRFGPEISFLILRRFCLFVIAKTPKIPKMAILTFLRGWVVKLP